MRTKKKPLFNIKKSKAIPSTEKIPFEQLPQTVLEVKQEISGLKTLITGLIHNKPEDNTDQWMNIEQLRAYYPDRPARSTIYDWVCQNSIPVHKDGKKLRFLKSEIDQWLGLGLQKTQEEIKQEAYDLTSNDDFTTWYRMNAEEHGSPLLGIEPKHKTTETNKSTVMITLNTLNPPQFSFFTHSTQGYP